MYQIKQYTVEVDGASHDVIGKLSDDGKQINFTVTIGGKEVTLDAKLDYQSKEDFEADAFARQSHPIWAINFLEWAIIKEFQAEISKLTNGDYWTHYLRHHQTFYEQVPDINKGADPETLRAMAKSNYDWKEIIIGCLILVAFPVAIALVAIFI